jgi:hypothetical protein
MYQFPRHFGHLYGSGGVSGEKSSQPLDNTRKSDG